MRGTLNHSSERSGFGEREIAQFFAKEHGRSFLHSPHAYGATLAQIDLVAIERKDILLRQPPLERKREHRFRVLALQCLFRREIRVLDELLSDSRAALAQSFLTGIPQQRARDTTDINARVIEEASILDGEYRLDEHR